MGFTLLLFFLAGFSCYFVRLLQVLSLEDWIKWTDCVSVLNQYKVWSFENLRLIMKSNNINWSYNHISFAMLHANVHIIFPFNCRTFYTSLLFNFEYWPTFPLTHFKDRYYLLSIRAKIKSSRNRRSCAGATEPKIRAFHAFKLNGKVICAA